MLQISWVTSSSPSTCFRHSSPMGSWCATRVSLAHVFLTGLADLSCFHGVDWFVACDLVPTVPVRKRIWQVRFTSTRSDLASLTYVEFSSRCSDHHTRYLARQLRETAHMSTNILQHDTLDKRPRHRYASPRSSCLTERSPQTDDAVLVMKPLMVSRRGVREYRPKGSQLRTVRWRVMESILQSAAVFTVSSLCFTVTTFVSPLGISFSHYFFPPIVVSLLSS